jgi:hypothetical protein
MAGSAAPGGHCAFAAGGSQVAATNPPQRRRFAPSLRPRRFRGSHACRAAFDENNVPRWKRRTLGVPELASHKLPCPRLLQAREHSLGKLMLLPNTQSMKKVSCDSGSSSASSHSAFFRGPVRGRMIFRGGVLYPTRKITTLLRCADKEPDPPLRSQKSFLQDSP